MIIRVINFNDIVTIIIPFFTFLQDLKRSCRKEKYKIIGEKSKDFNDFCDVLEIMKEKKHLTKEGLEQIKKIKAGMNLRRKS